MLMPSFLLFPFNFALAVPAIRRLVLALFLLSLSGCGWGPSSTEVKLVYPEPLRTPGVEVHRLAMALPSRVESLTGVSDPSRGKLDSLMIEIAERLPHSGDLSALPISDFHTALEKNRPPDFRAGTAMSDAQLKDLLVKSAAAAGADGVLFLHGSWDSPINLGKRSSDGRREFSRRVQLSVVAVPSGELVWSQEAIVRVQEGLVVPQENLIRTPVASSLVDNLLTTLR